MIGPGKRQEVLDGEAALILKSRGLSYGDAEFLLWCGKVDEAETYVLRRASELDGDLYYAIRPLAEAMEQEGRVLAATILYRALLESVLARAISKYYGHGVRYLHKLDEIAPLVTHWKSFVPHNEYFLELLEKHKRKSGFWKRYERKGRARKGKQHNHDILEREG